jgi:hypothetical protein
MEPWTRFTKKGQWDKEMAKRMFNTFTQLKAPNKTFKEYRDLKGNGFLII